MVAEMYCEYKAVTEFTFIPILNKYSCHFDIKCKHVNVLIYSAGLRVIGAGGKNRGRFSGGKNVYWMLGCIQMYVSSFSNH